MRVTNRLKKHSEKIDLPTISTDADMALSRAGVEVTKNWMDTQEDDLTSLEILAEMHHLTMLAVTEPLIRNRLITFIKILQKEEEINNA